MKIICIEGCSGSGKTTQFHLINNYYKQLKKKCLGIVEKNYEPFKSIVKKWYETKGPNVPFTKEDVINFAKARIETFLNNFYPLENKLDFIIMDRYFYTSAVYQISSGLSPKEILQINIDYGAPIPHLTFLLDCDPNICFYRINKRNKLTGAKPLFSKNPEEISKIRKRYLNLMKDREEVKIINSNRSIEEIFKEMIKCIDDLI